MEEIIKALSKYRFEIETEKKVQQSISEALASEGILHQREFTLEAGNIIDFFTLDERGKGRGIEVKLDGSAHQIYRQLVRYCRSGRLDSILLVTSRAMGLPAEIEGIPAFYFSLGRQLL